MIKRICLTDLIIIIAIVIALLVGIFTLKSFRQTADKQIEKTAPITFQILARGVTYTGKDFPITTSDKTFITIRNVPYTELNVTDVVAQSRKTFSPRSGQIVDDPAQPSLFDVTVTVSDVAKITKDGAVAGGNKIKIGLPVILEGKTYKIGGTISNVNIEENN